MPSANASAPDNAADTPYGTLPPVAAPSARKTISLPRLREMHAQGEKITILTAHRRLIG